ncbi:hypothetical protein PV413_19610 [Streptomyces scabiei]|uniref:hypothetical protein n=1 Tax=Streptomyces scabiei TaxID=1930 RepID=UPI0029A7A601|nr:hypothetical protein [Streptomyces scabiei]MDX2566081.1 hypothetical protein [Streptomyces scabiei]MDX3149639.1 hypothetical protein [Streptomyces scabiei]MDX3288121.1 hypothetical protein [Streptomyces scabiei]
MATTQLSYSNLVPNGNLLQPAGTTLVAAPTNDMQLANAEPEKTVLRVSNTDDDTALTFTVKAGDHPPALAAGQGDLAVTVAFGTVQFIGPFESGRFVQSDGSMMFTSSTTTGTVTALKVPRNT